MRNIFLLSIALVVCSILTTKAQTVRTDEILVTPENVVIGPSGGQITLNLRWNPIIDSHVPGFDATVSEYCASYGLVAVRTFYHDMYDYSDSNGQCRPPCFEWNGQTDLPPELIIPFLPNTTGATVNGVLKVGGTVRCKIVSPDYPGVYEDFTYDVQLNIPYSQSSVELNNMVDGGTITPIIEVIPYQSVTINSQSLATENSQEGYFSYSWEISDDGVNYWMQYNGNSSTLNVSGWDRRKFFRRKAISSTGAIGYSNICCISPFSTSNEHHVLKTTYNKLSDNTIVPIRSITYYDNMGRSVQNVEVAGAPDARDIVTPVVYDDFGRQAKEYLPYANSRLNNGLYNSNAVADQTSFFNSLFPGETNTYKENVFENSPLDRVNQIWNVGKVYRNAGKSSKIEYKIDAPSLRKLIMVGETGFKVAGVLSNVNVAVQQNEDGQKVETYTDSRERTLVVRNYIDATNYADTYYVYDSKDRLCWVVTPDGVSSLFQNTTYTSTSEAIKRYCYMYRYNDRGLIVEKRLPDASSVYMVYNDDDLMVASQDGNMRSQGKWTINKYDALGRTVEQWLVTCSTPTGSNYLSLLSSSSKTLITQSYYDSYPNNSISFVTVNDVVSTGEVDYRTKGLTTHETVGVVGENGSITKIDRTFYYDYKGRLIQTVERNHLGNISHYSTKYDLIGNVLYVNESHSVNGSTDKLLTKNTLDHRGRILTTSTTLNNSAPATIKYAYNSNGQLSSERLGDVATTTSAYNIQGWLTNKNTNGIFDLKLKYYDSNEVSTPSYTGNIIEMNWKHGNSTPNSYVFSYDLMGRLTNADQYIGGLLKDQFTEKSIRYTRNGNITYIRRNTNGVSENYNMSYDGNKLIYVNNGTAYQYDSNGNTIKDGRRNLDIQYNFLNLTSGVGANGTSAKYTYLADGTKVDVRDSSNNGFSYLGSLVYKKVGGSLLLESAPFAGGRIEKSVSGYDVNYYFTDHLGSVRAVLDGDGMVQGRNDYLPFGESWSAGGQSSSGGSAASTRYKFNGKELQTTGGVDLLDYGARMYDSKIGRWLTQDPLAEKMYSMSSYNYCANNPIKFIDPDGRKIKSFEMKKTNNSGSYIWSNGLSAKTNSAMTDYVGTKEGKAHLAQYAKKGDVVGGYEFKEDGALSDQTLNFFDYSYSEERLNVPASPGSGSFGIDEDKKSINVVVVSYGVDKEDVTRVITHETLLHGFKSNKLINGEKATTGDQDHKALKNKDAKHEGYRKYKSVQDELSKKNSKYKTLFEEIDKKAQEDEF